MRIVERVRLPSLGTLYLAQLGDDPGRLVEFVDTVEPGVPRERKRVLMLSTQLGCPIGCRICDAGALGFGGNLSADEQLAQLRHVLEDDPGLDPRAHPKLKIHFARMGEPALNLATLEALERLAGLYPASGILPSLSTVAPSAPAAETFFAGLPRVKGLFAPGFFQLQFSLHGTDERRRDAVVPARKWSLERIAEYGRSFVREGDRRITLNFALDREFVFDPEAIARLFCPERFLVKITPVNPTETARDNGADCVWNRTPEPLRAPVERLRERGFRVILSPSAPEEIEAATSCGQLWSRTLRARAATALRSRARERRGYVRAAGLARAAVEWKRLLEPHERRTFPLEVSRAALLVLDMQQLFLSRESPAFMPAALAVLPTVRRLAEAFRRAGRPVYFVEHSHEDPARDGGLMTRWWRTVCLAGSPWASIAPVLEPGRAAAVFRKTRYSAFTNPAIESRLRGDGIEELVLAGVATNLCVESTARDGFDLDFRCSVVLDATAAHSEEYHLGALKSLAQGFAVVRGADELCRLLTPVAELR